MREENYARNFELQVLPHLAAAHNLACWLMHNNVDAQDIVQEACLRAFRYFGGFLGGDARVWLLKIVRNTCYSWLRQHRHQLLTTEFDEDLFGPDPRAPNPEETLLRSDDNKLLRQALEKLPPHLRETLILRELEGMSYKEIAEVTDTPAGTVMSRLSRARERISS